MKKEYEETLQKIVNYREKDGAPIGVGRNSYGVLAYLGVLLWVNGMRCRTVEELTDRIQLELGCDVEYTERCVEAMKQVFFLGLDQEGYWKPLACEEEIETVRNAHGLNIFIPIWDLAAQKKLILTRKEGKLLVSYNKEQP